MKTNRNCIDDCVVLFDDGVFLFYVLQNELHYVHIYHQFVFVERRLMGEGGELGQCYIILGGWFAKLLYNIIWGRTVTKNDIFLLYNMRTAPYGVMVCNIGGAQQQKNSSRVTSRTRTTALVEIRLKTIAQCIILYTLKEV